MQTFLLWRLRGDAREHGTAIEKVESRLRGYCKALFGSTPEVVTLKQAHHALVYLELPVSGWKPRQFESDERTWALSLDYPVDADRT